MTFVYEHISDEDKKRIDFSKITVGGYEADAYQWVIDRELNAFLIWVYPEREPPYERWYAFCFKGRVFPVAILKQNRIQIPDKKWIIPVTFRVLLPEGVFHDMPELKTALTEIEEAIKVEIYGNAIAAGWGHEVSEVQVKHLERGEIK